MFFKLLSIGLGGATLGGTGIGIYHLLESSGKKAQGNSDHSSSSPETQENSSESRTDGEISQETTDSEDSIPETREETITPTVEAGYEEVE